MVKVNVEILAKALIYKTSGYYCGNVQFGYLIGNNNKSIVIFNLDGLHSFAGLRGCHIHRFGDMTNGCETMGPHFNPFGGKHGDVNEINNHLGDLGNILIDDYGNCKNKIVVNYLPITGVESDISIIGRGIVIHSNTDDLGKARPGSPQYAESIENGNSGSRIACGTIALCKPEIIIVELEN